VIRRLALVLLGLVAGALPTAHAARSDPTAAPAPAPACGPQVLVLAAMPLELEPLLRATALDESRTVTVEGRTFYAGRLGDRDVVLAMTGIGMENARITTELAYAHATCPFTATLFSGVAGSVHNIGDVAVPASWTGDGGATWLDVDKGLLKVASSVARAGVPLARTVPVGDAACACPGVEDPGTPVTMAHETVVHVGGQGTSADMFSGKTVPCLPGGGDVAGCSPCLPGAAPEQAAAFAEHAPPLLDTAFVQGFLQPPAETTDTYASQDMETAAAAAVARDHGVPFLGIRAVSDGKGDPLGLPGFPWQFFVYRRLAGNNAAAVTAAVVAALPA
jgi:nucleoside phosphorylase